MSTIKLGSLLTDYIQRELTFIECRMRYQVIDKYESYQYGCPTGIFKYRPAGDLVSEEFEELTERVYYVREWIGDSID